MNIIKPRDDIMDPINKRLTMYDKERLHYSAIAVDLVCGIQVFSCFPNGKETVEEVLSLIKQSLSINHKETKIYEKMLRYIKLLETNGSITKYLLKGHHKMFTDVMKLFDHSYQLRAEQLLIKVTKLKYVGYEVEAIEELEKCGILNSAISDEEYNNILNKIPTK